jgi:hypothetical protein
MNDNFLDHLFNVFGALDRANKKAQSQKAEARTARGEQREGRRIKRASFDEAPEPAASAGKDPSCCTAKR